MSATRYRRSGYGFLVLGLLLAGLTARAQDLTRGKITYVTTTSAYVDLGTNQGFDVGDTLRVEKKGMPVATLVVTNIASKSMATKIVEQNSPLRDGDAVSGRAQHAPVAQKPSIMPKDSAASVVPAPRQVATPAPVPTAVAAEPGGTRLRGRVALQYYALWSSGTSGFDFSQPALALSFSAENISGAPLALTLYSNHRYDARSADRFSGVDVSRWSNRIYQFQLDYGRPDAPFGATLGRFIAPMVGGVGTFDGAMLIGRSSGWEGGLIGGAQPGYRESEINTSDPKFAAYLGYSAGDWSTSRYQGSAAFAQTYKSRALDRSFLYIQNTYNYGGLFSLYQNADIDVYDLTGDGIATKPHLSDLFFSGTYRPLRWLSLNGSYAIRRNVYFLRSFGSMPDSLFDRSNMQNFQLSIGANLPMAMFISATGSLRTQEGSTQQARSLQLRYTWANILESQTNMYLTGSVADNIYNTSSNYGIEFNRDVIRDLYLSLRLAKYRYGFTGGSGSRTLDRYSASSDLYYRITKTLYASLSFERYWEGVVTSDRLYTEVTIRF